ncbi:Pentatricopeptide repeat-containing protein 2, mitochondrial [Oryzias melastigma]|uniref:Pentatricopeptide repeat-containing protein 2, mitochondrial n=1 Tax=Oryzias melastigma TaxID=30732 RepID=A0A834F035_ORYME|nr:Pentatricopeptide repeat-containing protein 2, mitochondrial [Oryzias melastigma]
MALVGRLGAKCCRSLLFEPFKGRLRGVLATGWIQSCVVAKRHLLSEDVIKLQDFQQRKLAVAHLVTGEEGNFVELFRQKLKRNELVLRDELKLLLHLCQSLDDMAVARDAIYRYHAENRNLLYGDFKFGPLYMRLCYEFGLEEMAASALIDKNLKGFFIDTTSFNIAIDMLFIKGLYERKSLIIWFILSGRMPIICQIFDFTGALEVLKSMRSQGLQFNKDTLTLAAGTCYKLNTVESYRICTALIEEEQTKGHFIPRHAFCFAIALALRQKDIEKAKSLFAQIMNTESKMCQNLKVATLAMSGEIADAVTLLSAAFLPKSPYFIKKTEFSQEVVDLLHLHSEGGPHHSKVRQIVTQLERASQVTPQTLDDMLCHAPMGKRRQAPMGGQRRTSRRTLKPLKSALSTE